MKNLGAELTLILRLFAHDAARQRKRMALTILAISWGTLSIVLLLSFGEGLKRSFHKNTRGMGEGIAVLWPGATKKAWEGLPSGRPDPQRSAPGPPPAATDGFRPPGEGGACARCVDGGAPRATSARVRARPSRGPSRSRR